MHSFGFPLYCVQFEIREHTSGINTNCAINRTAESILLILQIFAAPALIMIDRKKQFKIFIQQQSRRNLKLIYIMGIPVVIANGCGTELVNSDEINEDIWSAQIKMI